MGINSRFVVVQDSNAHVQMKRRALVTLFRRLTAMGLKPMPESMLATEQRDQALLFQHSWSLESLARLLPASRAPTAVDASDYFFRSVLDMQHLRIAVARGCHQVCDAHCNHGGTTLSETCCVSCAYNCVQDITPRDGMQFVGFANGLFQAVYAQRVEVSRAADCIAG
jgi:hypothetical protein